MQIKYLTNSLPTLSELKKRKLKLYQKDHCILCKEGITEDFDHLIRCSALQKLWKEIEEAVLEGISKVQAKEDTKLLPLLEIKEAIFLENKESRYQRRKELLIGLEENKMIKDLQKLAQGKDMLEIWVDSILFIIQRSFVEIIWNWRCEKVIL